MRLQGKVALISGGARGQGAAEAKLFAREGAKVVFGDVLDDEGRKTEAEIQEIGGEALYIHMDVTKEGDWEKAVSETVSKFGKLDILVNNVAIRPHKAILDVSNEEWRQVFGTNLDSAFYLMKAVLPGMMDRKIGSIVALGGQAAITGRPETSTVTSAKSGLLGLIRAVAAEMAPFNIRANMVNPGSTDTERMNPSWYPEFQSVERGSSEHLTSIPMNRQATVEDIANACLFYASDESGYITGDRMNVVGGRYIV